MYFIRVVRILLGGSGGREPLSTRRGVWGAAAPQKAPWQRRQGVRLPHQRLTVFFGRMQWVIWPADATREALHARSVRQRLGRSGNREGYSRGGWGRRRRRRWATPCRNFDSLPPWWGTGRGLGQDAWAGAGFWGVTCQAEAWHIMPADRPAPPLTGQGARGALDRPLYG